MGFGVLYLLARASFIEQPADLPVACPPLPALEEEASHSWSSPPATMTKFLTMKNYIRIWLFKGNIIKGSRGIAKTEYWCRQTGSVAKLQ